MACTEPQCLYKGALYLTVELYLYSPYGPYGLYRASVPVQGGTLLLLLYDRNYTTLVNESVVKLTLLYLSTRIHQKTFHFSHTHIKDILNWQNVELV